VNDRWGKNTKGKNTTSTYSTSEYGAGLEPNVTWEESRGIGHSYGYNRNEKLEDYKTGRELILILTDVVARGGNLLLDIGPTADGRIPVIMQERLSEIGDWLEINGEAIYGTEAWKQPYQWSEGKQPEKKGANYMAGYDVSDMIKPTTSQAYVEHFFTKKGKDLYCIIPSYQSKIRIRNFKPASGASAQILGSNKRVTWKLSGNDCFVDLGSLRPGDITSGVFVLKFKSSL
jgi:alpha-L-fucosidase